MTGWLERGIKAAFRDVLSTEVSAEFVARFATRVARESYGDGKTPMVDIIAAVGVETGVESWAILSTLRAKGVAAARQLAMSRCYTAGHSLSEIGRKFDRDHTTVLYAVRKFAHA
jgi:chromosomal replication initiation ATPase DnaA